MSGESDRPRPRIGITVFPRVVETAIGPLKLHTASPYYVDAVRSAGGLPLVLPVVPPDEVDQMLGVLDGFVLTGGGDVDPRHYGEERAADLWGVDDGRDAFEIAVVHVALQRRLPMLATCRGLQVVNVALGGTLVQDLPSTTGHVHSHGSRFAEGVHEVTVDAGSRLAGVLGMTCLGVNSIHHQAVDHAGKGVRPIAWAADGTVEAIEVDGHDEVVAVQWHPELHVDRPEHQALFRDLVNRAGTRVAQMGRR